MLSNIPLHLSFLQSTQGEQTACICKASPSGTSRTASSFVLFGSSIASPSHVPLLPCSLPLRNPLLLFSASRPSRNNRASCKQNPTCTSLLAGHPSIAGKQHRNKTTDTSLVMKIKSHVFFPPLSICLRLSSCITPYVTSCLNLNISSFPAMRLPSPAHCARDNEANRGTKGRG